MQIDELLISEARRRIVEESIWRIKRCLGMLTEEEIWRRPNPSVPSVGNLVLHLCGNTQQWVGAGLAGMPDERRREDEFNETGPLPSHELAKRLDAAEVLVQQTLDRIDRTTLNEPRRVQVYEESGVAILIHVIEHFSYHTGQITYYTKLIKNCDTGYYAGLDLSGTA